jgi:hypothetical protein
LIKNALPCESLKIKMHNLTRNEAIEYIEN